MHRDDADPRSALSSAAILAGGDPPEPVAPGYPTEFSLAIAARVGLGSGLGPFHIRAPGG